MDAMTISTIAIACISLFLLLSQLLNYKHQSRMIRLNNLSSLKENYFEIQSYVEEIYNFIRFDTSGEKIQQCFGNPVNKLLFLSNKIENNFLYLRTREKKKFKHINERLDILFFSICRPINVDPGPELQKKINLRTKMAFGPSPVSDLGELIYSLK